MGSTPVRGVWHKAANVDSGWKTPEHRGFVDQAHRNLLPWIRAQVWRKGITFVYSGEQCVRANSN
jgi:hypothetical protein